MEDKFVYEYERYYIEIPRKFSKEIRPLLNQDLKVEVKKVNGKPLIIIRPLKNGSASRKTPL